MQRAAAAAHQRMGLAPRMGYARMGSRDRWNPAVREQENDGPSISTGYLPTIEYLNYLLPAAMLCGRLRRFPIILLVSGVWFRLAGSDPGQAALRLMGRDAVHGRDRQPPRRTGSLAIDPNESRRAARGKSLASERWTYRYPRFVFALSSYTARRLTDIAQLPPERISVLRCPVNLDDFCPNGPSWTGPPRRYLLFVGRVDDPRKNVTALVRAYAPIAASVPDLDLVLVGRAQAQDNAVTQLVRALGISHRVHFPGHQDGPTLAALYRGAEAFVMTSLQEGLGIAVMEAQASGIPVVIMRCGGSDELVETAHEEDRNGWLVDQGDEEGVTRALRELATNRSLARRMGAAARRRAERDYSFDLFTSRLREVYRQVFAEVASELA